MARGATAASHALTLTCGDQILPLATISTHFWTQFYILCAMNPLRRLHAVGKLTPWLQVNCTPILTDNYFYTIKDTANAVCTLVDPADSGVYFFRDVHHKLHPT